MLKDRSFLIDAAGQSLIATLDQPKLPAVEAGGQEGLSEMPEEVGSIAESRCLFIVGNHGHGQGLRSILS